MSVANCRNWIFYFWMSYTIALIVWLIFVATLGMFKDDPLPVWEWARAYILPTAALMIGTLLAAQGTDDQRAPSPRSRNLFRLALVMIHVYFAAILLTFALIPFVANHRADAIAEVATDVLIQSEQWMSILQALTIPVITYFFVQLVSDPSGTPHPPVNDD